MSRRQRVALGGIVAAFALLFFLEGTVLPTAWLPIEESAALERARGAGSVQSAGGILYPVVLAPAARSLSPSAAHRFAKALSALLWALAAIPAYFLARRLVPHAWSLAVAALAVAAPAAVYSTAAVPDALALLLAVSSLPLVARGGKRALAVAVALAVAAALTRPWFVVLPPALLVAWDLPRAGRTFLRWPGSLAFAALAAFAYLVVAATAPEVGDALSSPGADARAAAAGFAVVVVGVGVVPWLLVGSRTRAPRETALLGSCLPALLVAAGVFGNAHAGGLDERPLLVLVPLVLALAAAAWRAREVRPAATVAVGALVVLASLALPALGRAPVAHAAGLGLVDPNGRSRALLVVGVAIVVMLAVVAVLPTRVRRLAAPAAFALLLVAGHAAAWWSVRAEARALAAVEPGPRGWVDHGAGRGAHVYVVGPAANLDERTIAQLRLWNRTVLGARPLDPSAVDPKTGLIPGSDADLVVERGVDLAGTKIARSSGGVLIRPVLPLTLSETVDGRYADGWSGEQTTYRRFAGPPRPGQVRLTVSRKAWGGPDRPGNVSVEAQTPDGAVKARRSLVIHSGQEQHVDIPVPPPPFRIVVSVSPTFSPADFGSADTRQLGAQLRFGYRAGS